MADIIETQSIAEQAIEKIEKELADNNNNNKYVKAVIKYVVSTITELIKQDDRFAEVVLATKRTVSDCCSEIMKGCGNYISDLEVYRKAAQFYFPNSNLKAYMEIEITGDAPDEKYLNKEAKQTKTDNTVAATKKPEKKKKPNPEKHKKEIIQFSLF